MSLGAYENGRLAIEFVEVGSHQLLMRATINLPDLPLEEGEVFIKSWSENSGLLQWMIEEGIISSPIEEIPLEFVKAHKCKLLKIN